MIFKLWYRCYQVTKILICTSNFSTNYRTDTHAATVLPTAGSFYLCHPVRCLSTIPSIDFDKIATGMQALERGTWGYATLPWPEVVYCLGHFIVPNLTFFSRIVGCPECLVSFWLLCPVFGILQYACVQYLKWEERILNTSVWVRPTLWSKRKPKRHGP